MYVSSTNVYIFDVSIFTMSAQSNPTARALFIKFT